MQHATHKMLSIKHSIYTLFLAAVSYGLKYNDLVIDVTIAVTKAVHPIII